MAEDEHKMLSKPSQKVNSAISDKLQISSHSQRLFLMKQPREFSIVTFASKDPKPKQIHTNGLSFKDLSILRKKDPFLYYSIPEIKSSRLKMKNMELPSSQATADKPCKVTRQSRISFECHPDLLIEDLMSNANAWVHDTF